MGRMALDWAERCVFERGGPDLDLYRPDLPLYVNVGQNLHYGDSSVSVEDNLGRMLEAWTKEGDDYDIEAVSCRQYCEDYTQVCFLK